ncbi:hypothetical protein HDK90DRAFT_498103 [Phyllosticta capitalensis]|uniref:Uncharacterized protein n=1 Tax=Phyllosticta capitalensis TaxID=121624 RepID=A0ABR1YBK2_9PEZI
MLGKPQQLFPIYTAPDLSVFHLTALSTGHSPSPPAVSFAVSIPKKQQPNQSTNRPRQWSNQTTETPLSSAERRRTALLVAAALSSLYTTAATTTTTRLLLQQREQRPPPPQPRRGRQRRRQTPTPSRSPPLLASPGTARPRRSSAQALSSMPRTTTGALLSRGTRHPRSSAQTPLGRSPPPWCSPLRRASPGTVPRRSSARLL